MKHPKFIIEGDNLVIGKAEYHMDLAIDKKDVISGGWYHIDTEKKELHLFGASIDFGRFTKEQVLKCVSIGTRLGVNNLSDYTIYYSYDSYTDKELLFKPE